MSKENTNTQKEHKVKGIGGYGCIIKPALKFKDSAKQRSYEDAATKHLDLSTYDRDKFVSKIMPLLSVMQEYKYSKAFTDLDPKGDYHIKTLAIGQAEDGVNKKIDEFSKTGCQSKMTKFEDLIKRTYRLYSMDAKYIQNFAEYMNEKLKLKLQIDTKIIKEKNPEILKKFVDKMCLEINNKFKLPVYKQDDKIDDETFQKIYEYMKNYTSLSGEKDEIEKKVDELNFKNMDQKVAIEELKNENYLKDGKHLNHIIEFLWENQPNAWTIMQMEDGGFDLKTIAREMKKGNENENENENEVYVIYEKIMRGVFYFNANNLYHCDIKMENIVRTENNGAKLIDYGLSTQKDLFLETDDTRVLIEGDYFIVPLYIRYSKEMIELNTDILNSANENKAKIFFTNKKKSYLSKLKLGNQKSSAFHDTKCVYPIEENSSFYKFKLYPLLGAFFYLQQKNHTHDTSITAFNKILANMVDVHAVGYALLYQLGITFEKQFLFMKSEFNFKIEKKTKYSEKDARLNQLFQYFFNPDFDERDKFFKNKKNQLKIQFLIKNINNDNAGVKIKKNSNEDGYSIFNSFLKFEQKKKKEINAIFSLDVTKNSERNNYNENITAQDSLDNLIIDNSDVFKTYVNELPLPVAVTEVVNQVKYLIKRDEKNENVTVFRTKNNKEMKYPFPNVKFERDDQLNVFLNGEKKIGMANVEEMFTFFYIQSQLVTSIKNNVEYSVKSSEDGKVDTITVTPLDKRNKPKEHKLKKCTYYLVKKSDEHFLYCKANKSDEFLRFFQVIEKENESETPSETGSNETDTVQETKKQKSKSKSKSNSKSKTTNENKNENENSKTKTTNKNENENENSKTKKENKNYIDFSDIVISNNSISNSDSNSESKSSEKQILIQNKFKENSTIDPTLFYTKLHHFTNLKGERYKCIICEKKCVNVNFEYYPYCKVDHKDKTKMDKNFIDLNFTENIEAGKVVSIQYGMYSLSGTCLRKTKKASYEKKKIEILEENDESNYVELPFNGSNISSDYVLSASGEEYETSNYVKTKDSRIYVQSGNGVSEAKYKTILQKIFKYYDTDNIANVNELRDLFAIYDIGVSYDDSLFDYYKQKECVVSIITSEDSLVKILKAINTPMPKTSRKTTIMGWDMDDEETPTKLVSTASRNSSDKTGGFNSNNPTEISYYDQIIYLEKKGERGVDYDELLSIEQIKVKGTLKLIKSKEARKKVNVKLLMKYLNNCDVNVQYVKENEEQNIENIKSIKIKKNNKSGENEIQRFSFLSKNHCLFDWDDWEKDKKETIVEVQFDFKDEM